MLTNLRRTLATVGLSVLAVTAIGCAGGGGGGTGGGAGQGTPAPPSGSIQGSVITSEDIQGTQFRNAYGILQQNRMVEFRQSRMYLAQGAQEPAPMLLVIDGTAVGTGARSPLESVSAGEIARIEILEPAEALSRLGSDAEGGAVVLTTVRGQ